MLTGVSVMAGTNPAGAGRVSASGGGWGTAREVPGTATLNQGGNANLTSVSCASAGNCSASGEYQDGPGHFQVFVVSETHGTWQKAEEMPGTATLNQTGYADLSSVSCASAGNCSAGGQYSDGAANFQAFVASETHGTWRKAEEVPGTAALNLGEYALTNSVSCASVGNCSAGGQYSGGSDTQAFVVSETHGTWGTAEEVPGTPTVNMAGAALVAVSCASAGNCTAGGPGWDSTGNQDQAFVVSETHGTWQKAEAVPGLAALNQDGNAGIDSLSCASAGNCSAGGYNSATDQGSSWAFVDSETHGIWQKAEAVPGIATLNTGGDATISQLALSCAPAGTCSAGGWYTDRSGHTQAFVVSKT